MGGLFALYEGIEKLRHPHETENLAVAIVILAVAIVLESVLAAHRGAGVAHVKADAASAGGRFIHRTKQPELPVVLLEDIGALIGLVLRPRRRDRWPRVTGNPRWDAVGSIAIGAPARRDRHRAGVGDEGRC